MNLHSQMIRYGLQGFLSNVPKFGHKDWDMLVVYTTEYGNAWFELLATHKYKDLEFRLKRADANLFLVQYITDFDEKAQLFEDVQGQCLDYVQGFLREAIRRCN